MNWRASDVYADSNNSQKGQIRMYKPKPMRHVLLRARHRLARTESQTFIPPVGMLARKGTLPHHWHLRHIASSGTYCKCGCVTTTECGCECRSLTTQMHYTQGLSSHISDELRNGAHTNDCSGQIVTLLFGPADSTESMLTT